MLNKLLAVISAVGALATPARADDCIPRDAQADLGVRNGALLACWSHGCLDVTVSTTQIEPSTPPYAAWNLKQSKACHGDRCQSVGKRFTAELKNRIPAKQKPLEWTPDLEVAFTVDHRIAVINGPFPRKLQIWDIKRDTTLTVAPPADNPRAGLSVAKVAADAVVLLWNDGRATVMNSQGEQGTPFRAGVVVELDLKRAVMIGWSGAVMTIDLAKREVVRTETLVKARIPFEARGLRLGDNDFAVLWKGDDGTWNAVRAKLAPDKPLEATAVQRISSCDY